MDVETFGKELIKVTSNRLAIPVVSIPVAKNGGSVEQIVCRLESKGVNKESIWASGSDIWVYCYRDYLRGLCMAFNGAETFLDGSSGYGIFQKRLYVQVTCDKFGRVLEEHPFAMFRDNLFYSIEMRQSDLINHKAKRGKYWETGCCLAKELFLVIAEGNLCGDGKVGDPITITMYECIALDDSKIQIILSAPSRLPSPVLYKKPYPCQGVNYRDRTESSVESHIRKQLEKNPIFKGENEGFIESAISCIQKLISLERKNK